MKRTLFLLLTLFLLAACEPLLEPPLLTPESFITYQPSETPLPTLAAEPYPFETAQPMPTEHPTPLPTFVPIVDPINDLNELVFIPGGSFLMGCAPDPNSLTPCSTSEQPQREVTISQFQINKYEISNASYQKCVAEGACVAPRTQSSKTRPDYYTNPDYSEFPVVHVTFQDAKNYCSYIGGRLPTEAEWEFAARGSESLPYPWGSASPNCSLANSYDNQTARPCFADTTSVGAYPEGVSPFGLMNMAGNVWEWVSDFYAPGYDVNSPSLDPIGPESGRERVVRGGGWSSAWLYLRATKRGYDLEFFSGPDLGFRCVVPVESTYPVD